MTVHQLTETMSNREFIAWQVFYGRKAQRIELEQAR